MVIHREHRSWNSLLLWFLLFRLWLSVQSAKRLYTGVLGNKVDKKVVSSWNYKQIWLGTMWIFKQEEFTLRCSCEKYYRMLNEQVVRTSVLHLVQQLAPSEAKHSFPPRAGHQFTSQAEGRVSFTKSLTSKHWARQTWRDFKVKSQQREQWRGS